MIVDRHGRRHYPAGTPRSKGGEFAPKSAAGIVGMDADYTEAQQEALRTYSSWEYHDINRQLRQGSRMAPYRQEQVDQVRSAMQPTPHDVVAYRRASGRDFGLRNEYPSTADLAALVGQRIRQPAFMSMTLDESVLAGHPAVVHMEVEVPAGTRAAYLHNVGLDHDQELLLDVGQEFEVLAVEPMESGFETRVRVRILSQRDAAPDWASRLVDQIAGPDPATAVDTELSWEEKVAAVRARRRFRYMQPGDQLSPDYEPGNWTVVTREHRLAQLIDQLRPRMRDLFYDDPEEHVERMAVDAAHSSVPDGTTVLQNGPHSITVWSSVPHRVDINELVDETDRLMRDYPTPTPLHLSVVPIDEMYSKTAFGETVRGTGVIRINGDYYESLSLPAGSIGRSRPGFYMDAAAEHPGVRYVLTHEWGHAIDPTGQPEPGTTVLSDPTMEAVWIRAQAIARRRGGHGEYFTKTAHEGYAEAFTEWVLSGGRTRNPVVRLYAKKFRWRRPSGNADQ